MARKSKEATKEYNAKYWATHRSEIAKARKKKYDADPDKHKARTLKWMKENKERWNAYMREYRKKIKAIDEMNKD